MTLASVSSRVVVASASFYKAANCDLVLFFYRRLSGYFIICFDQKNMLLKGNPRSVASNHLNSFHPASRFEMRPTAWEDNFFQGN